MTWGRLPERVSVWLLTSPPLRDLDSPHSLLMESGINLGQFTSPLLGVQMKDFKSLTKDWAIFALALLGMSFLTLSGGYSRGVAFEKSTAEKNHLNLTGHASSNELPFNDQLASPLYQ